MLTLSKVLTVFTKQACLSLQGTAGFAEMSSVTKAFLWFLLEYAELSQVCWSTPDSGKCSAMVFGLCF